MKYLIISADDFGYSKLFNKRILELTDEAFVSSTSVMVNWIDKGQSEQINKLIRLSKSQNLSIGLHIEFQSINFSAEIEMQFDKFVDFFRFEPSHLDLHKSTYLADGYLVIQEFCKRNKLPCRNLSMFKENTMISGVITTKSPMFEGSRESIDEIEDWLKSLTGGYYEIVFHPGYYDPEMTGSNSNTRREREKDAENIVKLNKLLPKYNIKLASYLDLKNRI